MAISAFARTLILPFVVSGILPIFAYPVRSQVPSPTQATHQAPAPAALTVFECIQTETPGRYATIARRAEIVTPPIILWQQTQYYTPLQRCQIVSNRLTNAVAVNGGRYSNLLLTYGTVNNSQVICFVNNTNGLCGSNNTLLTLRSDDNALAILRRLATIGVDASGGPLVRSGHRRYFVKLGTQLEQYLGADVGADESGNGVQPSNSPNHN